MKIPQYVEDIISVFNKEGYEAYVVGGAVRDTLLNVNPTDYDVTTNCPPERIIELFDKTIPTGIKHGTVTVIINSVPTEVTTYRIDGDYTDSRSPDSVEFTDDLSLDLSRRDFTINAMAYSHEKGLIDLFGGINDIENKTIRTVGKPEKRFSEDALRILRAIRFACQLNFNIEKNTLNSAIKLSDTLSKISKERIYNELSRALLGSCGDMLQYFINCGGFRFLDINSANSLSTLYKLPKNSAVRFYMFLKQTDADFEKTAAELKFSNNLHANIAALLELESEKIIDNKIAIKKLLGKFSLTNLTQFLECASLLNNRDYSTILSTINEILNSGEPYKISMLKINGSDLLKLGFKGKIVGLILEDLLNQCIINPSLNDKDILTDITKYKYSN